jgi:hypothetical protein
MEHDFEEKLWGEEDWRLYEEFLHEFPDYPPVNLPEWWDFVE